jgi:aspartate/methionine/tyrosine aminotransferase
VLTKETTVPFDAASIRQIVTGMKFDVRSASIREMNKLVNAIESELDVQFIRMEFGVPGLPVHPIAVKAEAAALESRKVGHIYAPFEGVPALKEEAALFVKNFMNIEVPPSCCIPTIGAMEGCFASLALACRMRQGADTVLFLEPGFPVNKLQTRFLGLKSESIDFYEHRGDKLLRAVEERAKQGDLCAIIWSSPNNPSWIVLKEPELEGLGRICNEHELIAIEDLAYFAMDLRQDYTRPGKPPYQPTVLHSTKRGISIISSSKMFSYAGQRIAITIVSPELMELESPGLVPNYGTPNIGHAFVHGVLYPIAACVPETPQYGLLALLQAANAGDTTLWEPGREYARRARTMKKLFLNNGFRLVYDNDLGEPLADGFYFTVSYPGFDDGADLLLEMLHYGISAITLQTTGSCRKEGLRACVSMTRDDQFPVLQQRLERFHEDHPVTS